MDGGCTMTDSCHVTSGEIGLMPNLEEVLAAARANSLTRDNPLLADLPEWFVGLRDHQRVAIREILTAYEEGAECVVLDAPTGSGKTLIGETVRRLLSSTSGEGLGHSTYICSSKALQDQFLRDYPYAKVLKGRSNYATESYPERFGGKDGLSCGDCTKTPGDSESCLWCSSTHCCPYEMAKAGALRAELAILNTSYFLSECNGPGRFSRGGLVIADECLAAGTLISTPNGPTAIEDIQVGDMIWGEEDGRVVETTVERTMVNEGSTMSVAGLDITGNHPILTARGYVPASQISPLDKIAVTGLNPSHGTNVRMVQTAFPGEEPVIFQRETAEILREILLWGMEEDTTEGSPQRDLRILSESIREHEENTAVLQPTMRQQMELDGKPRQDGRDIRGIANSQANSRIQGQNSRMGAEPRQSYLRSCCSSTLISNQYGARIRSFVRWQGNSAKRSSTNTLGGAGGGLVHGMVRSDGITSSNLLLAGYSSTRSQNRDRGRWQQSSGVGAKGRRPTQNRFPGDKGLERHPLLELGGKRESGGLPTQTVYNLSTTTHNYIANGVVVHNCDVLESELMSHVEVRISERRLKSYGLGTPRYVTKEESWREWAEDAYEKVRSQPPRHRGDISSDLVAIRAAKRHNLLVEKLKELQAGISDGGWVYTGDRTQVSFKPVTVDKLGADKFWRHGDKWLLMSATVISADELLESLGWDDEKEWRLVKCPSTFPAENRKVVVYPVANVTRKTKDDAYPKLVEGVKEILTRHPDDRVLIHSTSYALTTMLEEELREDMGWLAGRQGTDVPGHLNPRSIFTYTSPTNKDAAISGYSTTPAAILIAPSLERGIDLPGDLCRVQILCKVPWKSMDKQTTARLYAPGGRIWYAVGAIRTIVQSCGRAVRSEDDWAVSYIIDEQFVNNLWGNYRRLFPVWFKEGLVWKTKGL